MRTRLNLGTWRDHEYCRTRPAAVPTGFNKDSNGWVFCVSWDCKLQGQVFQLPTEDEVYDL